MTWRIGGVALAALGYWSFQPRPTITAHRVQFAASEPPPASQTAIEQDFDTGAFAVKLWNPPPPPMKPETAIAAEPPRPLNLQLIGIIAEAGQHKAALYDPDSDRLLIVAAGDRVRDHVVTAVTDRMVELASAADGSSPRQLVLRKEERS